MNTSCSAKILILGTSRTNHAYIKEGLMLEDYILVQVGAANMEDWHEESLKIIDLVEREAVGRVYGYGDVPALMQGYCYHVRPDLEAFAGINLPALLLSFNKAATRLWLQKVGDPLKFKCLSDELSVPDLHSAFGTKTILKPIHGTASLGIQTLHAHDKRPNGSAGTASQSIPQQIYRQLGLCIPEIESTQSIETICEEYIPISITRVSVDGLIDREQRIQHVGISENHYITGNDLKFHSQSFPSSLPAHLQDAIWQYYDQIVKGLAFDFQVSDHEIDVEMFVDEVQEKPFIAVMEVNFRKHPNVEPIYRRLRHEHYVHQMPPSSTQLFAATAASAGAMHYVWVKDGDTHRAREMLDQMKESQRFFCPLAQPYEVDGEFCLGWLYTFASTLKEANQKAQELLEVLA